MAINYARMRALIDADAANVGRSAQQVLDSFWLATVTVNTDVPMSDFLIWLSGNGGRDRVQAALAHADEATRNAALLMIDMIRGGSEVLSLSRGDTRAALAPLVGSGKPFNATQRNSLLAMSNVSMPRWRAEGFRAMDNPSWLYHIAIARAL